MAFFERYNQFFEKNRGIVIIWFACLFFIVIAGHAPKPTNHILIEFNKYVTISYICIVLITMSVFGIRILLKVMLKESFGVIVVSFFDICIKTAVLLQCVKGTVGGIGDNIYDHFREDPLQFFLTSLSVFIVCIAGFVAILNKAKIKQDIPTANSQQPTEISNLALRFTAAHEAGHALVYSLIKPIPEFAEAKVNYLHGSGSTEYSVLLGYTLRVIQDPVVTTRNFAEWEMLSFLAGQMGEMILLGEQTLGSVADFEKWHILVRQYLGNQNETIYYLKPESEYEFRHNLKIQNQVLERQRALLNSFFTLNKVILDSLYNHLIEHKHADSAVLSDFFVNIKYIPELPILEHESK